MTAPTLRVAVFGDSVMEGQGLRDQDKFTAKGSRAIASLLGRSVDMVVNSARSGAQIEAAKTAQEARQKREEFVDTYPAMFNSEKLRSDFIDEDIQEVALLLTPELPATFPTISYQVRRMGERFPESTRLGIDLVFLDGGANDLDFQEYLNPEDHRHDYIKFYEPKFEEFFHQRTKKLITQARELFPNAVILYTGLYTPFLPEVSNGDVKELFEHESEKPGWQIWLNNNIIEIKNVDQLVREAQYRSLHGLTRGLYWMRRTIAEINEDAKLRGPGILFIHPQFKAENTVFAANSFIHKEYELDELTDKVREVRANLCPRNEFRDEMNGLISSFISRGQSNSEPFRLTITQIEIIKKLRQQMDGPTALIEAFQKLLDHPSRTMRDQVVGLLFEDLRRINNALRASFLHPNEKGAQRYTDMILKRYKERIHRIRFREDLRKLQPTTNPSQTIKVKGSLKRFGFREPLSLRNITQDMEVDSIRLTVKTADISEKVFIDELILDMGGENRWMLTLRAQAGPVLTPLNPQLVPGTTDIFTIDAGGVHLGSLKQFVIERHKHPLVDGEGLFGFEDWRPTQITLQINGRTVFDVPFFGNLSRGGKLTFPYPS